jgi:hypothetical protein
MDRKSYLLLEDEILFPIWPDVFLNYNKDWVIVPERLRQLILAKVSWYEHMISLFDLVNEFSSR